MNSCIKKALNNLENAKISGYFKEMDKVVIPKNLKHVYAQHKGVFTSGLAPWNFHEHLETFARQVGTELKNNTKNSLKPLQTMVSDKKSEIQENIVPQKGFDYAFIFGILLVSVCLFYVLFKECITEQAFFVIRFLALPIGLATFGAWLPGQFGFDNKIAKGVGAMGLLAMAYFFNPAETSLQSKICGGFVDVIIEGTVKLNSEKMSSVAITCLEIKRDEIKTDKYGTFVITNVSQNVLDKSDSLTFVVEGFKELGYPIPKSVEGRYTFNIYLTEKNRKVADKKPTNQNTSTSNHKIKAANQGIETLPLELDNTKLIPQQYKFNIQDGLDLFKEDDLGSIYKKAVLVIDRKGGSKDTIEVTDISWEKTGHDYKTQYDYTTESQITDTIKNISLFIYKMNRIKEHENKEVASKRIRPNMN
jgi:hypothetical protein